MAIGCFGDVLTIRSIGPTSPVIGCAWSSALGENSSKKNKKNNYKSCCLETVWLRFSRLPTGAKRGGTRYRPACVKRTSGSELQSARRSGNFKLKRPARFWLVEARRIHEHPVNIPFSLIAEPKIRLGNWKKKKTLWWHIIQLISHD